MVTTETKYASVYLAQDGGVSGPRTTLLTTADTAVADAIAWAESQAGHPWDCLLVNVYDEETMRGECESHQVENIDGSWEIQ